MGSNVTTKTKRGNIIEFQDKPFSDGSMRQCFRGKIISGPDKGDSAVIKVFKLKPLRSSYIDSQAELKVYSYANDYARMFNDKLKSIGFSKLLSFPEPDLVTIKNLNFFTWIGSDYFNEKDYICAEVYLHGVYRKWTNNGGYSTGTSIMEAFQHYTFIKSGKRAICCDLQGVESSEKYQLTDPACNSVDRLFGNTDMGSDGIKKFIGRHKCNEICKAMGLQKNTQFNPSLAVVNNSTTQRRSHTSGI